ncbi:MAG: cobalamin B12-binding domain-containing protein [Candidatus Tectomicrobia bacterium]|uniref:Cobalamin B12-binding domain-containing protein n=1 Tax=Tectimicrobiota bacterium TaxID=2528274 RepID=A0A932HXH8_UNCTE|nr:cobalamin B12-binding domain-containing protein [Candidatus Tectomicrobia bacterium]
MKILLLNPSVHFDKQFGTLKKFYTPIPSIGLAYVGAVLRQNDFEVVGLDAFIECLTVEEMRDRIVAEAPDVLGVSLLTPAAPLYDRLAPLLKERLPGLKIVLGNIHASAFADHYLSNGLADYMVHHEGEFTMLELVESLRDGRGTSNVKGISYRNVFGQIIHNPDRPWIDKMSLDEMPYPAWDLFPVDQFRPDIRLQAPGSKKRIHDEGVQALGILATRGCPHRCTFCSPINTIGNKYRMRTPKSTVDEMEYFHRKWGVETFYYMDLTFPISERLGIQFCDELIARGLPTRWMCETRVSSVTYPLLVKMKQAGCARIDYGIECGNQKMLDSIKKGFTIEQVRRAVDWTRKAGIQTEGLFIIGLPGETERDTWDTINFALSLDLDHIKLNLFVPYPGSELWDVLKARGELTNMDFNEYTSYPTYTGGKAAYVPAGRTYKDLIRLQKIGMRKAMFRKRVILRELSNFRWDKVDQYFAAMKGLLFPPPVDMTADRFESERTAYNKP